jgi:hypothetical protein
MLAPQGWDIYVQDGSGGTLALQNSESDADG